ncbi:hypothetical protein HDU67_000889 [Dinochytrium kinnereticum]|nr:hypothetical protein HDU67_000889 [Dinochytrium kinnereticum]
MPPKSRKTASGESKVSPVVAARAAAKAEEDVTVEKGKKTVSNAVKKTIRKIFPVARPLFTGLFLTNAIDYIAKMYQMELDTSSRMGMMIVGYLLLNEIINRLVPSWVTYDGPDEEFFATPVAKIDNLVLLKGEPVTIGEPHPEGKRVVTVELSKLAKKYAHKDVNIASITFEEKVDVIKEFLLHLGPKIEYNLFWDAKKTAKNLIFDRSLSKGIPFCLILNNDNKVVWMGNPHDKKFLEALDKEAENATDRDPSTIKKFASDEEKSAKTETKTDVPEGVTCEGDICTIDSKVESKVEKRVGRKVQDE